MNLTKEQQELIREGAAARISRLNDELARLRKFVDGGVKAKPVKAALEAVAVDGADKKSGWSVAARRRQSLRIKRIWAEKRAAVDQKRRAS